MRKCLEKDPDDRWQSAHDVASELRWLSEAGSQAGVATTVTLRRKSRERLAWALAALLAVTAVTLGVAYVGPTYAIPGPGYVWAYHANFGWGWHHPQYGWHRGWR